MKPRKRWHDVTVEYVSPAEPSDVFVSYSREISDVVDALLARLPAKAQLEEGEYGSFHKPYRIFRDVMSIRSGQLWDKALTEAVMKAKTLIVILSPSYHQSPICMFELLLFLNRDLIVQVVKPGEEPVGFTRYYGCDSIFLPYRAAECVIPAVIQRYDAPMIPTERPLPEDFVESVRDSIESGISQADGTRIMGAGGWGEVGPERDMLGLRDFSHAAKNVLELCDWLLEEGSPDPPSEQAVLEIKARTIPLLRANNTSSI